MFQEVRRRVLQIASTAATCILVAIIANAQSLTTEQKSILAAARAKYYSLELNGFESASCKVSFDFSTVPELPSSNRADDLNLLEKSVFTLQLGGTDRSPVTVQVDYPSGTTAQAIQNTAQLAGVLKALVQGTFQTWGTKGLHGPIPAFDSEVKAVTPTDTGFTVVLSYPGDPVRIELDRSFLVKEILSIGGKIDEKPVYTVSPDGWVYTGNEAVDNSEPTGKTTVIYELKSDVVDGLRLPTSVHLRVNQNIDTRFSLHHCEVKKGKVIQIAPPAKSPQP
jgi:hypothetical protein